jgi:hypothetical protein
MLLIQNRRLTSGAVIDSDDDSEMDDAAGSEIGGGMDGAE